MRFEHVGLNVPDARAMGAWYAKHLGMSIVLEGTSKDGVDVCFLADATGRMTLEVYTNRTQPIPDYAAQHPLVLHIAFAVDDAAAERDRLIAAGATLFEEIRLQDGSHIVILRDPWNVPLQLCQRTMPFDSGRSG